MSEADKQEALAYVIAHINDVVEAIPTIDTANLVSEIPTSGTSMPVVKSVTGSPDTVVKYNIGDTVETIEAAKEAAEEAQEYVEETVAGLLQAPTEEEFDEIFYGSSSSSD